VNAAPLDPREHPFREDLAASYLQGMVAAGRYADGDACKVSAGVLAMHGAPDAAAGRVSELLFGEIFTVYDHAGEWAWGQCQTDGYVGYVRAAGLTRETVAPTHEIAALRSYVFAEPDLKSRVTETVHMTSRVAVTRAVAGYCLTDAGGWISRRHLVHIGAPAPDCVVVARRYIGAPYLWGGRSSLGLDCSALVQLALARTGRLAPRDSDQQERSVGVPVDGGLAAAVPGDLLYMKGHVAMLATPSTVLHANAHHMAVAEEPLDTFLARLETMDLAVSSVRRP
jgi:cell wall-associated NlpC family hydrolase